MRYKAQGQRTVFDELFEKQVRHNRTTILEEIGEYLDFEIFRPTLERVFVSSGYGPSRFDVVLMLKVVFLQKWYDLSDPEAEAQISDRISFRSFLGLSFNDSIPDETTICRFRNHLKESEQYEWLFEVLNEELRKRHVLVKTGSMVDATFIKAPKGKGQDGSKTDPDAEWGHKGHGYSMHVNMEKESKIMEDIEVTSARPHDSQHFEDVLIGDETDVYADSAYRSEEQEAKLAGQGIKSNILEKAKRNKPLTAEQKASNKVKSKVRARVEHGFGQIKTHDGFTKTRYYGLAKNRCDAFLHAIAYNLRRGLYLLKKQVREVVDDLKERQNIQLRETCV
jgi:IS5 family transposase